MDNQINPVPAGGSSALMANSQYCALKSAKKLQQKSSEAFLIKLCV